jgi:hypothetical protein
MLHYARCAPVARMFLLAGLVVLACFPVSAKVTRHDVIIMKNGDHMTGEVKKLENGVLYIATDYFSGSIGLDWLQVAKVESTAVSNRAERWKSYGRHDPESIGGRSARKGF